MKKDDVEAARRRIREHHDAIIAAERHYKALSPERREELRREMEAAEREVRFILTPYWYPRMR